MFTVQERTQIAKLLAMLGSDSDGEALSAARALARATDLQTLAGFIRTAVPADEVEDLRSMAAQFVARVVSGLKRSSLVIVGDKVALLRRAEQAGASITSEDRKALLRFESELVRHGLYGRA